MKFDIFKMIATMSLVGSCSLAQAAAVTFTDPKILPEGDFTLINSDNTAQGVNHDINALGYNPATDTLISAMLRVIVRDDVANDGMDIDPPADPMVVFLDGTVIPGSYEVNVVDIFIDVVDLSTLAEGLLTVVYSLPSDPLQVWDFNFKGSELVVVADRVVPIPAAAWLFISALGGLVVIKRKQLKA